MRDAIRILIMVALAAACSGSGDGGSGQTQPICAEPGNTCNDGLCFNGAANGVCDQNLNCRTDPSTSGDCVVFITKATHDANMGGLAGADAICQRAAVAAGLKGTFKAWLSDSKQSAAQRLTHGSVNYVDTRGQVIANDWADLTDASLQRAITVDETGYDWDADAKHCGLMKVYANTWTGTATDGSARTPFCADWTTTAADAFGTEGYYCYASEAWTASPVVEVRRSCSASLSLYCIQQ